MKPEGKNSISIDNLYIYIYNPYKTRGYIHGPKGPDLAFIHPRIEDVGAVGFVASALQAKLGVMIDRHMLEIDCNHGNIS